MKLMTTVTAAAMALSIGGVAQAAPITGTATQSGAIFSITLESFAGDLYDFKYTADFTNYTGNADYIIGINYKPSSGDVLASSNETTSAAGTWTYAINDNLNAGSTVCGDANTGDDFFCGSLGSVTTNWDQNPTTGIYTWDFTLQIAGVTAGSEDSLVFNAPIRALFATFNENSGNWQNSLASLTTGPSDGDGGSDGQTPEPATMALFGLGLAFAASRLRKSTR